MTYNHADEIRRLVARAALSEGIVNVPAIALDIHRRNPAQAIFEIEHLVLGFAELSGVPIMFDQPRPPSAYRHGLLLEFVTEMEDHIADAAPPQRQRVRPDNGETT